MGMDTPTELLTQTFPDPKDLRAAVEELAYLPGWVIELTDDEDRGQGCRGLTLNIYPDKPDSYHPERHVRTRFLYPVPAATFNRESWEEWLWARIEETEGHERAEWFRFVVATPPDELAETGQRYRRPFKPAHPDGWDPGVVRSVVSETVTNTPNAGRLVTFPCACGHAHHGRMGEHFTIERAWPCPDSGLEVGGCDCQLGKA